MEDQVRFGACAFFNYLVVMVLVIIPIWKILQRIGLQPALSLLMLVPLVNLLLLYYVAFTKWPREAAPAGS